MDFVRIISELRDQRDDLDRAIFSLERLALLKTRKRGRPRKPLSEILQAGPVRARALQAPRRPPKAVGIATGT